MKAKDADEYIFTKESYVKSPNLFATSDFKEQIQLSDTNPQQAQYNWGTDELVNWTTPKAISLQVFCSSRKILIRIRNIL